MDKVGRTAKLRASMKSNLSCTLSLGVFLVCALYTVWLSLRLFFSAQELQQLQYTSARIDQNQEIIQALANEALEYSKKNPAIDPILRQFEIKPKTGATNSTGASPSAPRNAPK